MEGNGREWLGLGKVEVMPCGTYLVNSKFPVLHPSEPRHVVVLLHSHLPTALL